MRGGLEPLMSPVKQRSKVRYSSLTLRERPKSGARVEHGAEFLERGVGMRPDPKGPNAG